MSNGREFRVRRHDRGWMAAEYDALRHPPERTKEGLICPDVQSVKDAVAEYLAETEGGDEYVIARPAVDEDET